ncbi:MAG: hypothetical protein ABL961_01660 [Vicinamibacterales bacterium]
MSLRLIATLAMAAALSTACKLSTPQDNTVDQVSGTIPVGGADFKTFDATKNGEIQITVTTLTPTPSASLGMYLGVPVSGACALYGSYYASVVANRTVEFGYVNKANYCVQFYDTGALTVPTEYTAKISHP